jgi:phosphoribosylformylglycinamidine synthase
VGIEMKFVYQGMPQITKQAAWTSKHFTLDKISKDFENKNLNDNLKLLLSDLNIASKEWIIRQYDFEVQGQTVGKPLNGKFSGHADASVIWPYALIGDLKDKNEKYKGIVLSNALNPEYGKIDPYWMAASAIDEALRNIAAVGGDISRTALLDNFCIGSPENTELLGELVRAILACYDFSKAFQTPFISGKDSLYNEHVVNNKSYPILSTLLISAVSVIPDIRNTVSMDLKAPGNLLYMIGKTKNELGGSHYFKINKLSGGALPKVDAAYSRKTMTALFGAIQKNIIVSCHDCSQGGLAVAVAEMCIASGLGAKLDLSEISKRSGLGTIETLFSESNSRFIVEIKPKDKQKFQNATRGLEIINIGDVSNDGAMVVNGTSGEIVINEKIDVLSDCWKKPISW